MMMQIICLFYLGFIHNLKRPHKILVKTIGEWSDHILGYTNTNYPEDDLIWIQYFTKIKFQIVFS